MVSYSFIILGLSFLIYGGWQLYESKMGQEESLAEAREIIANGSADIPSVSRNDSGDDMTLPIKEMRPVIEGDVIGILDLPRLNRELPIIAGTHEDDLARGVGHYTGTKFPGENDQILLSGHRDTVFRQLGKLEIGDKLVMEMSYGTFTYEIRKTKIVDADDRTIIGSTAPEEVLVLSTCYPFRFVGDAPDRYIIYAYPVEEG